MIRAVLAALAVLVAGCGTAPSGLSPDDAFAAALQAVDAGEVPRALVLLEEAADAGHLGALAYRADSYRTGYLKASYGRSFERGQLGGNRAFLVLPGQAEETEQAYRRALSANARGGDPDATFQLAFDLANPQWIDGDLVTPPARADSARVLYRQLQAAGADEFQLAVLAGSLGDLDARNRHLKAASRAGNEQACWLALWMVGGPRDLSTVAGFSDYVDDAEACPRPADGRDPVSESMTALARQARAGTPEARTLLDSLRADDLFQRHPRLADAVAGA